MIPPARAPVLMLPPAKKQVVFNPPQVPQDSTSVVRLVNEHVGAAAVPLHAATRQEFALGQSDSVASVCSHTGTEFLTTHRSVVHELSSLQTTGRTWQVLFMVGSHTLGLHKSDESHTTGDLMQLHWASVETVSHGPGAQSEHAEHAPITLEQVPVAGLHESTVQASVSMQPAGSKSWRLSLRTQALLMLPASHALRMHKSGGCAQVGQRHYSGLKRLKDG